MCNHRNSTKISRIMMGDTRTLLWRKLNGRPIRVDSCLVNLIIFINAHTPLATLSSCCGHGKYNMSIVVEDKNGNIFDLVSNKKIPRKKRFYVKDKEGFYFIPETI